MDIYNYINSCDVAAHCREINKKWNAFEMAVIIARSSCIITEKHAAWKQLMAEYPDMNVPENMHRKGRVSLREKLSEVIDYEEKLIFRFTEAEKEAVYQHRSWCNKEYQYSNSVFFSHKEVLADIHESLDKEEVYEIVIMKHFIGDNGKIEAFVNYDGNIQSIYANTIPNLKYNDEMFDFKEDFYVDIPVPFKRGDILTCSAGWGSSERHLFVLDFLLRDDERLFNRYISGNGDATDMIAWGFYSDNIGAIYGDHTPTHDCLEYYRGKLEGKDRILHYISLYLQGLSDNTQQRHDIELPDLLTMQVRIILEHILEENLDYNNHGVFIANKFLAENRPTP